MIKGFIFDVDGVIINTENSHFLAYKNVFQEFGYDLSWEKFQSYFSGKSIRGGVLSLLAEIDLINSNDQEHFIQIVAEKKIARTIELFKKQVVFFDDTISFIQQVSRGNVRLKGIGEVSEKPLFSMATGLEPVFLKYILPHHNLQHFFSVVITADQYTHSKPDPECYSLALKQMGLPANAVVGVEDSPSGIKALNNAGIYSIGITNTFADHELKEAKCVTEALTELIEK